MYRYCWLLMFLYPSFITAGVVSCVDSEGKKIFTDKTYLCVGVGEPKEVEIETGNFHSQFGLTVSKEYRNYAFRAYKKLDGFELELIVEKALYDADPELAIAAAKKLEANTLEALALLPKHSRNSFSDIRYYIFIGDESRTGGRHGGQWYFRESDSMPDRFDNSIVVRSAKDYLTRYKGARPVQTAVHELSHAYYYYNIKESYYQNKKAYESALEHRLYLNVKYKNGGIRKKAYALKNNREYFAEISKIYFAGSPYYPFNRQQLKDYDPQGYAVVESVWGIAN